MSKKAKLTSKPKSRAIDAPAFAKCMKDGYGALFMPLIPSDNLSLRVTDNEGEMDHGERWGDVGWYKPCKGYFRSAKGLWYPATYSMPKSSRTGKRFLSLRIPVETCDRDYGDSETEAKDTSGIDW